MNPEALVSLEMHAHPAHGAEALVDPLVPLTRRDILAFLRQRLVASVKVWRQ